MPGEAQRAIDLGTDQCTLYLGAFYTGVVRYDVCRRERLPTIEIEFMRPDVRALANGDVLVVDSGSNTNLVYRYDSRGVLVRTYALPLDQAPGAIALENEHTAVIVTSGGMFHRLNLLSGTVTQPWPNGVSLFVEFPRSLMLYRGFTAALGPTSHAPRDVPSLTNAMLVALAAFLAMIAARRAL